MNCPVRSRGPPSDEETIFETAFELSITLVGHMLLGGKGLEQRKERAVLSNCVLRRELCFRVLLFVALSHSRVLETSS